MVSFNRTEKTNAWDAWNKGLSVGDKELLIVYTNLEEMLNTLTCMGETFNGIVYRQVETEQRRVKDMMQRRRITI